MLNIGLEYLIPSLPFNVIGNDESFSEILNIVDDDESVLGAGVDKSPQVDLPLCVHPHVPEHVLREPTLHHGSRQLLLSFQHQNVIHNVIELLKCEFFVSIFIDEHEDLGELVRQIPVGKL